jgi:predicted  nucleic acid-binding Zn-ribbon protein
MDPGVIGALIPVVAILAFAAVKIARIFAANPRAASTDAAPRLEALEHTVLALQQELAETQERLDFAERLLSKTRDEHRIGNS